MEIGNGSMEYFTPELERDLIEIMNLGNTIGLRRESMMGTTARFAGEEKVGELLRKARQIANKHHPQSFAVSVGIPFGAQVSFTWDLPDRPRS